MFSCLNSQRLFCSKKKWREVFVLKLFGIQIQFQTMILKLSELLMFGVHLP